MSGTKQSTETRVALVAGSTGYVGQAVVAALRDRGITTLAHARPASSRLAELRPTFEGQGASIAECEWEADTLTNVIRENDVSHVFCLIGTTRKQASREGLDGKIYERVDQRLTTMLADACASQTPAPRFIYLSSVGADANASSAYLQARGHAEAAIRALKLPHVIARPSFITGPDRDEARPAERIGAAIANGALSLAGLLGASRTRTKYSSTTATDLASRLVELALGHEEGTREGRDLSLNVPTTS